MILTKIDCVKNMDDLLWLIHWGDIGLIWIFNRICTLGQFCRSIDVQSCNMHVLASAVNNHKIYGSIDHENQFLMLKSTLICDL